MPLVETPEPPYTAVIFSSIRTADDEGYLETAMRMMELAAEQPGYLGFEHAANPDGTALSVSYWVDEDAARAWKQVQEHVLAQERGRAEWYADYRVRVATVGRAYGPG